jgi:glycosyltransferase involved in cell wall biosynthesis
MFSVLILTLDEERNLPACLASVTGCNDIVVLDSGSTDRTVAIARDAGARAFERAFTDFADQRNFALETVAFKNEWVFHLDADERLTPDLLRECDAVAANLNPSLRSDPDRPLRCAPITRPDPPESAPRSSGIRICVARNWLAQ